VGDLNEKPMVEVSFNTGQKVCGTGSLHLDLIGHEPVIMISGAAKEKQGEGQSR